MKPSRVESHDLSEWRQAFQRSFGDAEVHLRDADYFFGLIQSCRVGIIDILSLRATLSSIRLPVAAHDLSAGDVLSVIVNLSMDVLAISQIGRSAPLSEGEATVVSDRDETLIAPTAWMNAIILRVPARCLPGPGHDFICRTVPQDDEALRLLLAQLNPMRGAQEIRDPLISHELGRHLASLLRLAIIGKTAPHRGRTERKRLALEDVLVTLSERYPDPALSVNDVAEQHHVSTRTVQTLFQETGSTFSERLLELRLERAFELLLDGRNASRKIIDIAFECGFTDPSYFHRRFRERFGVSAGKVRPADARRCTGP